MKQCKCIRVFKNIAQIVMQYFSTGTKYCLPYVAFVGENSVRLDKKAAVYYAESSESGGWLESAQPRHGFMGFRYRYRCNASLASLLGDSVYGKPFTQRMRLAWHGAEHRISCMKRLGRKRMADCLYRVISLNEKN